MKRGISLLACFMVFISIVSYGGTSIPVNAATNEENSVVINVKDDVPIAPTTTDKAITNQVSAIKGQAAPGATVKMQMGADIWATTADKKGNFTFDLPVINENTIIKIYIVNKDGKWVTHRLKAVCYLDEYNKHSIDVKFAS